MCVSCWGSDHLPLPGDERAYDFGGNRFRQGGGCLLPHDCRGGRGGAALSVWIDGAPVVELAGSVADERTGREFTVDTLAVIFSCTKGMASVLVAVLMERGLLPPLGTPVTDLWPEFETHGKDRATIGDALAHRAGLSAPRRDLTIDEVLDNLLMADAVATREPLWATGEHHQYHAVTRGAITAKLVTLATGQPIGRCLEEQIARSLKADAWIGLPKPEEPRVACLVTDTLEEDPRMGDPDAISWVERENRASTVLAWDENLTLLG